MRRGYRHKYTYHIYDRCVYAYTCTQVFTSVHLCVYISTYCEHMHILNLHRHMRRYIHIHIYIYMLCIVGISTLTYLYTGTCICNNIKWILVLALSILKVRYRQRLFKKLNKLFRFKVSCQSF